MLPGVLSYLQQEFKYWHEILSHRHPKSMFRLAKLVVLPAIFLHLKDDVSLCEPCMFGIATTWKHKKTEEIRVYPQRN